MTLIIRNPANGEIIDEVKSDNADSIAAKFQHAKEEQAYYWRTPLEQRMAVVERFGELLAERSEELARLLTMEMGKPITQSRAEIESVQERIQFFVSHVQDVLEEQLVRTVGPVDEALSREPLGVVANISAWNYPYFVGVNVFLPAYLCGNAVLYKPSELATLTGIEIGRLMHESGVATHMFQTIVGGGDVGRILVEQPVDGLFFTGSKRTGLSIARSLGGRMLHLQLELGGKDPVYICDDADIEHAAHAVADGSFYNAGQGCCSVERIYVHEDIYDEFLRYFMNEVSHFVVGDPFDDKTYIGPLSRREQLDVMRQQVSDAVRKGAHVACGGESIVGPGNFFQPTVLLDVNHSMDVMREESFGPIVGLQRVRGDQEAFALMDDTDYGLTAAVFSRDSMRANKILSRLKVGSAYVNCCDRVSTHLPWSGRRGSGLGCTSSVEGIKCFTHLKAWHMRGV